MSKADDDDITGPAVPGGRTDGERFERRAGPAEAGPEEPPPLPRDIPIGRADVHLVLARLLHWGIPARVAAPDLPYDLIAEPGEEFGRVRIRVRTIRVERRRRNRFALRQGHHHARRGTVDDRPGEFDLAAFVTLDLGRVQFRARLVGGVHIGAAALLTHGAELRSWFAALSALRAGHWAPPDGDADDAGTPAWPTA